MWMFLRLMRLLLPWSVRTKNWGVEERDANVFEVGRVLCGEIGS
jgi:hypothetical protein